MTGSLSLGVRVPWEAGKPKSQVGRGRWIWSWCPLNQWVCHSDLLESARRVCGRSTAPLLNQPGRVIHTSALGLDFGEWPLGDRKTEAQTELVACLRSPNRFLAQLRLLECSSLDLQSDNLSSHTVVESSYRWSTVCPRLVRWASLASSLATGGVGVVHNL